VICDLDKNGTTVEENLGGKSGPGQGSTNGSRRATAGRSFVGSSNGEGEDGQKAIGQEGVPEVIQRSVNRGNSRRAGPSADGWRRPSSA
jgi:hypothetical protein